MCIVAAAPAAVSWIAAGLTAAGTLYSAYTQHQAGEYNAAIMRRNAEYQELAARDAERRGVIEEQNARQQTELLLGRQRASMAAAGLDLSMGSPLGVLESTAAMGELDAQTIRANAQRESWGLRVEAANTYAQAHLAKWQGNTGAIGTLISGAGETLGIGMRSGIFGTGGHVVPNAADKTLNNQLWTNWTRRNAPLFNLR